ncbi:PREDICTED: uncharacterized protein LOC104606351 [Nelumbo nucifera]|uniref:Uncharacterized protein LOC104606351 n=1 Tax=Nelumbo nucifera TaxID=4432 RepID=A0A1U8B1J5_NELNU|nr:PREDICTED: uncharacterized protein LOC104606351 [Nelumbo nucifera]
MDDDLKGVTVPHDDALVVAAIITNHKVKKILVDNGSSVNILFYDTFERMKLAPERLQPVDVPLVGFSGSVIRSKGKITLPIMVGIEPDQVTWMHEFLVVKVGSPYNIIMGRPTLYVLRVAMSFFHLVLKFPTEHSVGVVRGNQQIACQCYVAMLKGKNKEALSLEGLNLREEPSSRGQPVEDLVSVPLDEANPKKAVHVGSNLPPKCLSELIYIDFIDLNGACLKDSFPLPWIDHLIDATVGYELLNFMDAFSGYNQIKMHPEDEEKTPFITEHDTYCYKVMPFGLKNAGATYQCLVNKVFKNQMGRNVEAYVDDIVVKSQKAKAHTLDLDETFDTLRKFNMKLNPNKCAFNVTSGKFLGFFITQRDIETNPNKMQAILDMAPLSQ